MHQWKWALAIAAAAIAVLIWWHYSKKRAADDALAGLPTAPPAMPDPYIQQLVDGLFQARSNCRHANKWMRVTFPTMLLQLKNDNVSETPELMRRMANSLAELDACGPDAYVQVPGGEKVSVASIKARFAAFEKAYARITGTTTTPAPA